MGFTVAGILNICAGLAHLWVIAGRDGARYRLFGAGEELAAQADAGKVFPHLVTIGIAAALFLFGWLAFAEAGLVPQFWYGLEILWLLAAVYFIRGLVPLLAAPFFKAFATPFSLISSLIVLFFAVVHLVALAGWW